MPEVLRNGVLDGLAVCVAGGGDAVAARCEALGADVARLNADLADEDAVAAAVEALGAVDVLVCDAGSAFGAAGGGMGGLRAAVDGPWNAVRAVVNARWTGDANTDGAGAAAPGGKVVLLAPAADAGRHAAAVGAALENAARTLSVEWARFGVRTVAVLPATDAPAQAAEIAAFLASPAGDYYSGCVFHLRA